MSSEYHKKYYRDVYRIKLGIDGPMREFITDDLKQYVKDNYDKKTSGAMAEELGISRLRIKHVMRFLNLKTTPEQRKNLKRKKTVVSPLAMEVMRESGRRIGLKNPIQKKDYEVFLRKNHFAANRIEKYIRVPGKHYSKRMVRLAVYNWEKANGKVPKGKMIFFKTDNYLNCELDNLECLSRAEWSRRAAKLLTDKRVAYILSQGSRIDKKEFLQHRELIDLKRSQLQLKRVINEKNSKKKA